MYICNSTAKIHIHTNVFTNKYTQKNIMYVSYIHTTNIIFIHFPQMPIHAMKCSHFICNRLGHLNCLQSCIACRERHSVGLCFFLYFLTFTARTYMYIQTYLYHTHIHLYFSFFMYFFCFPLSAWQFFHQHKQISSTYEFIKILACTTILFDTLCFFLCFFLFFVFLVKMHPYVDTIANSVGVAFVRCVCAAKCNDPSKVAGTKCICCSTHALTYLICIHIYIYIRTYTCNIISYL
ncbi:unnamed protein product [Ceratitis capitata]|uniref:(Mediterranean fruit fly) hypothetical protein n=1 Tax=Ceratitis capitata TaxID=7213 RepID=A0A811V5T2_CERCA|nr:unnamed protein product [Ceratitis capitata]